MTGSRLRSPMKAIRRCLSSCLELTRMWRNTERASLEKKPSMRLSHEPWRECEGKALDRLHGKPARGLARDMGGMVVEDDLDRVVGGVGGVEKLEKLDEFTTAVAFLDQGMDVTAEQIDTCH